MIHRVHYDLNILNTVADEKSWDFEIVALSSCGCKLDDFP